MFVLCILHVKLHVSEVIVCVRVLNILMMVFLSDMKSSTDSETDPSSLLGLAQADKNYGMVWYIPVGQYIYNYMVVISTLYM